MQALVSFAGDDMIRLAGYHFGNMGKKPILPTRIFPRRPRLIYLKAWREYLELTLEEVGNRFDPPRSKSTVQRLEAAGVNDQKLTKGAVEAYAEALGRPIEDVYREPPQKGEPEQPSLDQMATKMGVSRQVVIDVLMAVQGRKAG